MYLFCFPSNFVFNLPLAPFISIPGYDPFNPILVENIKGPGSTAVGGYLIKKFLFIYKLLSYRFSMCSFISYPSIISQNSFYFSLIINIIVTTWMRVPHPFFVGAFKPRLKVCNQLFAFLPTYCFFSWKVPRHFDP